MADQATVKRVQANIPHEGVVGGIAEFGNDIATLVELQAKLAVLDFKECQARAMVPLVMAVSGIVIGLASLPVALFGVASLLASALTISEGWALLLSAAIAMVVAVMLAVIAVMKLRTSFESFRRTREELVRNISWIRTVLMYSGRSVQRRVF